MEKRFEFGQRTLFDNRKEVTTFDGFNLGEFMGVITKLLNKQDEKIKELQEKLEYARYPVDRILDDLNKLKHSQNQKAIEVLEKVNGLLTDIIINVTENEFDINKLCYLEEISARFGDKNDSQIAELRGKEND